MNDEIKDLRLKSPSVLFKLGSLFSNSCSLRAPSH